MIVELDDGSYVYYGARGSGKSLTSLVNSLDALRKNGMITKEQYDEMVEYIYKGLGLDD